MQRALISGIAVAAICSAIGLFLVLRKHSLFGDAMSHVAFGGLSIGLFLNLYPIWTAYAFTLIAALGITKMTDSIKIPPDSSIAILLSSGLALGIVLISLSGGYSLDLFSFLFGSILLISTQDTVTIVFLSIAILLVISVMYRRLMYITFDEKQAQVSGINVKLANYVFIVLAATTVVTSIRLVGVLLISALIVLPNITAILFGRGFKKTAMISMCIAIASVLCGIVISYLANVAPAGAMVLTSVAIFLCSMIVREIRRSIRSGKVTEPNIYNRSQQD
ncbi:MAG TPA: metal ABC transporter permease [Nitrososphaeraceae archaeon]|nr:metal ABC transporter permease [Nitrososphaeraceae archaeon]